MGPNAAHSALRQVSVASADSLATTSSEVGRGSGLGYSAIAPHPPSEISDPAAGAQRDPSLSDGSHDELEDPSPSGNTNEIHDANDLKRPRACEACRQLKVKCELDENEPTRSCKRCAKARRECIITVPSRKRQKKTDSRVAELEKKIDALTATLATRSEIQSTSYNSGRRSLPHLVQMGAQDGPHDGHSDPVNKSTESVGVKRKHTEADEYSRGDVTDSQDCNFQLPPPIPHFYAASDKPNQNPTMEIPPYVDVVDRNLLDVDTACKCFDRYHLEMCQYLPIVVFAPCTKAQDIRKSKPILFLTVLAAASGTIRPDLQSKLTHEAMRILADRVVYKGEKSLELVQALQVLTIFYHPPDKYDELNFNQLVHIAAVMAMDIGMGKRSRRSTSAATRGLSDKGKSMVEQDSAESRRCWLGNYYMCMNSAMSLRRAQLIRWSPYADECVHILLTADDALPSDRFLVHLIKAHHIGEDIGLEFSMDDPASVLSLTDPRTQRHLRAFEQNLADWHAQGGDLMQDPIMRHTEAIIDLYMHEISMHHNHNIDDFRPPFRPEAAETTLDPESLTPAHIESLTSCLYAIHNAFDAFLSIDVECLRSVPTHFFVRNSYAAVALIKLFLAVSTKGSKFGPIFKAQDLKIDLYFERVIGTLMRVAAGGKSRVAHKFTVIFTMLRNWYHKQARTATKPIAHDSMQRGSDRKELNNPTMTATDTTAAATTTTTNTAPPVQSVQGPFPDPSGVDISYEGTNNQGLQMLSDAAMHPSMSQWSAGGPPKNWGTNTSSSQNASDTLASVNMDSTPLSVPFSGYGMAMAGYATEQLANGGYTSDDFMALGLEDDWMNWDMGYSWEMNSAQQAPMWRQG